MLCKDRTHAGLSILNQRRKLKSYKKALAFGLKAVNLIKISVLLGIACSDLPGLRERDKLMESARKAIAIRSTQYDAYDILGDAFSGSYFKAFRIWTLPFFTVNKAWSWNPNLPAVSAGWARTISRKADYTNAELSFGKSLELNPKHAGSHDYLGKFIMLRVFMTKRK